MDSPNFQDPMFIDASAPGGLNPAFIVVSGSAAQAGSAAWSVPGLIQPENMITSVTGLTLNVFAPYPFGVVTASGVAVYPHGTQTGIDTQGYNVSFASLVPATGSVTAYLAAAVTTIQQNPVPVPGPPPGHPAYDPTFVPTVAYAVNQQSLALSAVTGGIDNITTFELLQTTLTAGQSTLGAMISIGQIRTGNRKAKPPNYIVAGGLLTVAQSQYTLECATAGITSTLPDVGLCSGLEFTFVNPTNGNWIVSTTGGQGIDGFGSAGVTSVTIPSRGSMSVWGNSNNSIWHVVGAGTTFTPVQQGGGAGQGSNKIFIGWDGTALRAQVDSTDLGDIAQRTWTLANFPQFSDFTASFSVGNEGSIGFPNDISIVVTKTGVSAGGGLITTNVTLSSPAPNFIEAVWVCFNGNTPPGASNPGSIGCDLIPGSKTQVTVTTDYVNPATLGIVVIALVV